MSDVPRTYHMMLDCKRRPIRKRQCTCLTQAPILWESPKSVAKHQPHFGPNVDLVPSGNIRNAFCRWMVQRKYSDVLTTTPTTIPIIMMHFPKSTLRNAGGGFWHAQIKSAGAILPQPNRTINANKSRISRIYMWGDAFSSTSILRMALEYESPGQFVYERTDVYFIYGIVLQTKSPSFQFWWRRLSLWFWANLFFDHLTKHFGLEKWKIRFISVVEGRTPIGGGLPGVKFNFFVVSCIKSDRMKCTFQIWQKRSFFPIHLLKAEINVSLLPNPKLMMRTFRF